MDPETIEKILSELYPHLERMETQSSALLQFLTAKGIVKDEEFAPFLEQAGNASYVKWLTTRLRIEHVLSTATRETAKPAEIKTQPPQQEPEEKPAEEKASTEPAENAAKEARPEGQEASAETDADQSTENDEDKPRPKKQPDAA